MGCCNKTRTGEPIGRARYLAGLVALGSVQAGMGLALGAAAVVMPRYRKLLPFYADFCRTTLASVVRREGIRVTGADDAAECTCEVGDYPVWDGP